MAQLLVTFVRVVGRPNPLSTRFGTVCMKAVLEKNRWQRQHAGQTIRERGISLNHAKQQASAIKPEISSNRKKDPLLWKYLPITHSIQQHWSLFGRLGIRWVGEPV